MRTTISLVLLITAFNLNLWSQKEDYIWYSGYKGLDGFGYDSQWEFSFGNSIVDFNYSQPKVTYDSLHMNFDETNVSYCSRDGNLLFKCNGIYIANALDQKIENSDSMNAGYFQYAWDSSIQTFGYREAQGILAFQNPADSNQYYLLHSFIDTTGNTQSLYCKKLLCTLLDMHENQGNGKTIYKNSILIQDNLGPDISAVRHGNGRDWWLIMQKRNSNCYYEALLDGAGIHIQPSLHCENISIRYNNLGASNFSEDGAKYAYFSLVDGVVIFDFDRCNGALSNSNFIPIPGLIDSGWIGMGVCFSPNDKYLYVCATKEVYQYDLSSTDIAASKITVAIYDGYHLINAPGLASLFTTAQMGPDGKIYISCGNSMPVYHVINTPDEQGDSCHFLQHSLHLPSPSLGVPHFPNYRLGPLSGSACDTLTGLDDEARAAKEQILKVFPNPAKDVVTIDYGFTNWNKGEVQLEITNALGQVVYEQHVPMYSGFQRLDVAEFAAGVYTTYIKRNNSIVAISKFVKE
jgi:hypothetical protein